MANELRVAHVTAKNVYFQIWNGSGQIYNTASAAFETYATANIGDYDVAGTEAGTASGVYLASMPSLSAGLYHLDARERVGASPAEADLIIGSNVLVWNGTGFSVDTYQAKIWLTDDNNGEADRYVTVWFKNSQPVTSGITSPTIQVFNSSGTDLIASIAMTQIGTTGTYRYVATGSERTSGGVAYLARAQATIDGATRTWYQPVSRDSV